MDGTRFDGLARRWSSARSRRSLLGVLAASAVAALGGRRVPTVAAQPSDTSGDAPCAENADCLDGVLDPCTGATCADGVCAYHIADCAPGYTCCGNGTCCPEAGAAICVSDADCAVSDDPCSGGRCEGGTCVVSLVLCADGFACCGNGACCPIDAGCASDADCGPSPNPCLRGRCLAGACIPAFVTCPAGATCRGGACVPLGA